jgi:hypothetical protein
MSDKSRTRGSGISVTNRTWLLDRIFATHRPQSLGEEASKALLLPAGSKRPASAAAANCVKESRSVFYDLLTLPARPRCRSPRHIGMLTQSAALLRRGLLGLIVVGSAELALTTATKNGARNSPTVEMDLSNWNDYTEVNGEASC